MFQTNASPRITRTTPVELLPELLSPDEVRAWLGLGRSTVYDAIRRGELPHKRFGRMLRVPKAAIVELAR